jgi:MFS transporter, ACS family, D-galactonate transporter
LHPYILAVVYAGFQGSQYFIYTWFATYLVRVQGVHVATAGLLWATAVTIPPLVGQPMSGWISDRFGPRRVTACSLLVITTLSLLFAYVAAIGKGVPLWAAITLIAVLAIFLKMWVVVWPFTTLMFPTKSSGPIGGAMNTLGQLVGATAPVISGYFIQAHGSFVPVFLLGALCSAVAFAASFGLREHRVV